MAVVVDDSYCMIASGLVLRTRDVAAPFVCFMQNTFVYCIELVVNCCLLVFHGSGAPFRLHALLNRKGTAAAAQQPARAARSIS